MNALDKPDTKRILVCTDCLSEGINLQYLFDAVIHYDLTWNPTRHEQREGRIDRYGQIKPKVRVLTYYGKDNPIDGIVLDVLIKKHKSIRSSLGISVPVPAESDEVVNAIFEGLLLREKTGTSEQILLPGLEEYIRPQKEDLHKKWDMTLDKEKRSRSVFAQHAIKFEQISGEINEYRKAVGSSKEVESFITSSFRIFNALVNEKNRIFSFNTAEMPHTIKDAINTDDVFKAKFELPVPAGTLYLGRTHRITEGMANFIIDSAIDTEIKTPVKRCGVIRSNNVNARTSLLLIRFRYQIVMKKKNTEKRELAEECRLLAFTGAPDRPVWLNDKEAEELINIKPDANVLPEQAKTFVKKIIDNIDLLKADIEKEAKERSKILLSSHQSVRAAAGLKGLKYEVEPKLPADILGVYIYLPAGELK